MIKIKKKIRTRISPDGIMRHAVSILSVLLTERELSQRETKSILAKALSLLN